MYADGISEFGISIKMDSQSELRFVINAEK